MKRSTNNTVSSRCHERKILAAQVAEFLQLGGKITLIDLTLNREKVKPKGSVWQGNERQ